MSRESKYLDVWPVFRTGPMQFLIVMSFFLAVGCEGRDAQGKSPQAEAVNSISGGQHKLLEGDANRSARSALYDYRAEMPPTSPETLSYGPDGLKVDRTVLGIAFAEGATIGEVNTMLMSVEASIVGMLPGVDILEVIIPDPGDLTSYEALVQQVESDPVVRYAIIGALSSSD